jgi:hypothetical protein
VNIGTPTKEPRNVNCHTIRQTKANQQMPGFQINNQQMPGTPTKEPRNVNCQTIRQTKANQQMPGFQINNQKETFLHHTLVCPTLSQVV